ncbi:pyruvate ferredoxin oxidoreductase [Metallosphaera hakonensis]|uniref:2-oxoacid oxidoreductase (ferredoxin) n=1 Tax=Metallosphaera hakonensis JCM 8857 = DSM 7519 TaxID=1293036 RepID=A0A2U9IT10_9CREN|nr:pyruvate ferredoxin oxidoreductase [Metallosphaera hakonensis]AWR99093.1 pyruvate ferredoxin oxidoreductase [Metallosphaera hakonensis JCM 8857 = DSM 7519]
MMKVISGNEAVALAVKLARVGVVGIYPITPQTTIIEELAEMKARGEISTDVVRVESEHSAMGVTLGAAVSGVRAFTATSSQGLLYMHEMIWWAAGSRAPIVMVVATRAVGAPWNIWNENTDFMSERDSGWIMSFASSPQEALDLTIQAFRISEDPRVFTPMMVGMDGFILSHTKTNVYIPSQEEVDQFIPPRRQPYVIDPETKESMGNIFQPYHYMKLRQSIHDAINESKEVITEVGREYEKLNPLTDYKTLNVSYKLEDADFAVVTMGAWSLDAMEAVDRLRDRGVNVGLYRVRYVRPWAEEEIIQNLGDKKAILVFDRATSLGRAGPLYLEMKATLDNPMKGVIAGLGGVSMGKKDFYEVISRFVEESKEGRLKGVEWYYPREVKEVELGTPRSSI